jgi:hypothetical protein
VYNQLFGERESNRDPVSVWGLKGKKNAFVST